VSAPPRRAYTVVGVGAIGGTLAWSLARAGHPVSVVDADLQHLAAVSEHGLVLERNGLRVPAAIDAIFTPDNCPAGLTNVLLAVKAHATAAAAQWLAEHLADDGFVVSMQNGLNEPLLGSVLGLERIVGGFVDLFADVVEPGVIAEGGSGAVAVGEVDGHITRRVEDVVADLQAWGPAAATANILGFLWSKLGLGAMLAATALADASMADLVDRHRPAMHRLAGEVLAVAAALAVRPEPFDGFRPEAYGVGARLATTERATDTLVAWLRTQSKQRSGIWRDIAVRRRPTEVPAQFLPVLAAAGAHCVKLPLVTAMLRELAEVEREPASMSEKRLYALDSLAVRETT